MNRQLRFSDFDKLSLYEEFLMELDLKYEVNFDDMDDEESESGWIEVTGGIY